MPTPRNRSPWPPQAIGAPILVGTVRRRARLDPRQPGGDQHGDRVGSAHRAGGAPRQADRAAVRGVPAVAWLLPAPVRLRRSGRLFRPGPRQRGGACRRRSGRGGHLLGGDLRPRAARVGARRRPVAGGADQQRHVRRDDERAAVGVRQGARRRARPLRRGRRHHRDQCGDRPGRPRAGPHRVLRARLSRQPGAAQDHADPGDPVGARSLQWVLLGAAVAGCCWPRIRQNGWFMRRRSLRCWFKTASRSSCIGIRTAARRRRCGRTGGAAPMQ